MREAIEQADANLLVIIKEMREATQSGEEATIPAQWTCFRSSFNFTQGTNGFA
jgi:hypothetical protein